MTTLRIPPGIVIGDSHAQVLGRWNNANLIRWKEGRMKPIAGWTRISPTPLASPPRNGRAWLDNNFNRNAAFVCDGKVYRQTDAGFTDITPVDFLAARSTATVRGYGISTYGSALFGYDDSSIPISNKNLAGFPVRYTLDNWGEQLLFGTSTDGRIFVWDPVAPGIPYTVAAGLPAATIQDFLVTDERHLMIFGYAGFPNRVAWSSQEDRTDWNFSSVTGSAGFQDLTQAGFLLAARKIMGGILIWTTSSVWFCRYIGAPYFYSFVKLEDGATPLSPQAIATYGNQAMWMGQHQMWSYSAGQITPVTTTLGDYPFEFLDLISGASVATAGHNGVHPELWFFYPRKLGISPGVPQPENNSYIIYNYAENWWSIGNLPRSFFQPSPIDEAPLAGDFMGNIYQHEKGYLDGTNPRLSQIFAEATVSFDDGLTCYTSSQGRPDPGLDDPRSVQFDVRARTVRNGPSVPKGPYVARPDGKIDMRFTASDFDFRVSGLVDGPWAFGAMVLDAKVRGKR